MYRTVEVQTRNLQLERVLLEPVMWDTVHFTDTLRIIKNTFNELTKAGTAHTEHAESSKESEERVSGAGTAPHMLEPLPFKVKSSWI